MRLTSVLGPEATTVLFLAIGLFVGVLVSEQEMRDIDDKSDQLIVVNKR